MGPQMMLQQKNILMMNVKGVGERDTGSSKTFLCNYFEGNQSARRMHPKIEGMVLRHGHFISS